MHAGLHHRSPRFRPLIRVTVRCQCVTVHVIAYCAVWHADPNTAVFSSLSLSLSLPLLSPLQPLNCIARAPFPPPRKSLRLRVTKQYLACTRLQPAPVFVTDPPICSGSFSCLSSWFSKLRKSFGSLCTREYQPRHMHGTFQDGQSMRAFVSSIKPAYLGDRTVYYRCDAA
ncbi:LAQU0S02e07712g1_1 [Lachancea quebecensis]|uniref:LAQU0S02e07712g1_1 n=1 Tax=Lachancea quebecensis TaxID=1654605 RepID=A0A0N7ML35_9SACH|nr:LAQU0S02e07712g1_1 [Lachancea quebecensis]